MNINWTREALDRLEEIETYISKDSTDRAVKFVDDLIEHANILSDTPFMGRTVPELGIQDIRVLIFKKYRIVYRVKKKSIEILTVFEGHRLIRIDEIDI